MINNEKAQFIHMRYTHKHAHAHTHTYIHTYIHTNIGVS